MDSVAGRGRGAAQGSSCPQLGSAAETEGVFTPDVSGFCCGEGATVRTSGEGPMATTGLLL